MRQITRPARRFVLAAVSFLVVAWLAACAWLVWSTYRAVHAATMDQLAAQQMTLATQAARGIEDHIAGLRADLELLAGDDRIIAMGAEGAAELMRYQQANAPELQSVTRMGPTGVILATFPNRASTGASIREQAHVQRLLSTHQAVLSDVFTSVQGYRSIALHVPVFRAGAFDGSIAILIPVDYIAEHFLAGIGVGNSGYTWVISRDGIELYCVNPAHLGRDILAGGFATAEERALAREMALGVAGTAVMSRDHASGLPVSGQITYRPIRLVDNLWSVAVEAPQNEILQMMAGFLKPFIFTIAALLGGIAAILLLAFRLALLARERRAREAADARYRSLVEQLPAINYVVEMRKEHRTVYISPQLERILGFTPEQWVADRDLWLRQVHPDDRARVAEEVRRNDASGVPTELEYRVITRGGEVRWIHNRSTFLRDDAGTVIAANGVMLDITERRRAEDALRESEERYRTLMETTPLAVTMADLNGTIVFCNPQTLALHGARHESEILGKNAIELIAPEDRPRAMENLRRTLAQGGVRTVPYTFLRLDGTRFPAELNASLIVDKSGSPRSFIAVSLDITERLAADRKIRDRDERLMQSQKLEAVGRLAGGVAHDFNNLLTVIRGYADLMADAPGMSEALRADAGEILKATRQAQTLTDQLLAYSRKQIRSPQVLDVNAQVRNMEAMLRRLIGEHIVLVTRLAHHPAAVRADPGQMEQVIMNLAVNARDSMQDGGTLTIGTANVRFDSPLDAPQPGLAPGPYVLLVVCDTGTGMSDETLAHIFEPFFTTKEKGKGTGLGLSTVYGIVTQNGGSIYASSAPDDGARFSVYLPRVEGEAPAAEQPAPPNPRLQGTGTILLAEDEAMVRNLARAIIAKAGYTVHEARNGREALEIHAALPGPLDLLVTDVIMPEMGGVELAKRLSSIQPGLRVLYISGYTDDALGPRGVLNGGIQFLRKPFSATELLGKIGEILAMGPQGLEPRTNGL
jgi:two-component system cell cycle sensor histidine kinase/response regulator CckA